MSVFVVAYKLACCVLPVVSKESRLTVMRKRGEETTAATTTTKTRTRATNNNTNNNHNNINHHLKVSSASYTYPFTPTRSVVVFIFLQNKKMIKLLDTLISVFFK